MANGSGHPQGFAISKNDASRSFEHVRSPWDKIQELEELIEYHSYYFGYLLGQYTDKEFKEIALTFVRKK